MIDSLGDKDQAIIEDMLKSVMLIPYLHSSDKYGRIHIKFSDKVKKVTSE